MEKTASPETLSRTESAVSRRSSSSSADSTSRRLFADSRPISTMSAPSSMSSRSTYSAASLGSLNTLGLYGDSLETFSTPMIRGGWSSPISSPAASTVRIPVGWTTRLYADRSRKVGSQPCGARSPSLADD
ncbi:hypothetical protein D320_11543 [Haloferax sp. BAB-2207]|nr:hypothetical protein D320_11543 [Haloferax sp. BAB-2207]